MSVDDDDVGGVWWNVLRQRYREGDCVGDNAAGEKEPKEGQGGGRWVVTASVADNYLYRLDDNLTINSLDETTTTTQNIRINIVAYC